MNNFVDDRGYSIFDVFPLKEGQVNYSELDSSVIKAFHRHKLQTDYWCCIKGKVLIVLVDDKGTITRKILSEKKPEVLEIKPNIWHGYRALNGNVSILYFCTKKYNKDIPDEERCEWTKFGLDLWNIENK